MTMKKIQSIKSEEQGFASLIVAFILILVMSLLIVGFAQVARREQQNALTKQLANQAYYAAESGVNAIKAQLLTLKAAAGANPAPPFDGSECLGTPWITNNVISPTNGISYSCPIVNFAPKGLTSSNTTSSGSGNFIFSTPSAEPPLDSLTFSWGSDASPPNNTPANSSCNGAGCFPPISTWLSTSGTKPTGWPPVVQLSITPLGTGNFTRNGVIQNTFTAVLYPTSNAAITGDAYTPPASSSCPNVYGNINYAADGYPNDSLCNGVIMGADYAPADPAYPFSATINNLNGSPGESWLVHYVYNYGGINTCIQAGALAVGTGGCIFTNTSSTTTTSFIDSEVQVDVTGKAKNAVKRISEVLPVPSGSSTTSTTQNGISTLPPYAISAGDVCKEFATNPQTPGPGPGILTPANTAYNVVNPSTDCSLGPP